MAEMNRMNRLTGGFFGPSVPSGIHSKVLFESSFADVTLSGSDREQSVLGHRVVLSSSPFLRRLFHVPHLRTLENLSIFIPDVASELVEKFIHYLYGKAVRLDSEEKSDFDWLCREFEVVGPDHPDHQDHRSVCAACGSDVHLGDMNKHLRKHKLDLEHLLDNLVNEDVARFFSFRCHECSEVPSEPNLESTTAWIFNHVQNCCQKLDDLLCKHRRRNQPVTQISKKLSNVSKCTIFISDDDDEGEGEVESTDDEGEGEVESAENTNKEVGRRGLQDSPDSAQKSSDQGEGAKETDENSITNERVDSPLSPDFVSFSDEECEATRETNENGNEGVNRPVSPGFARLSHDGAEIDENSNDEWVDIVKKSDILKTVFKPKVGGRRRPKMLRSKNKQKGTGRYLWEKTFNPEEPRKLRTCDSVQGQKVTRVSRKKRKLATTTEHSETPSKVPKGSTESNTKKTWGISVSAYLQPCTSFNDSDGFIATPLRTLGTLDPESTPETLAYNLRSKIRAAPRSVKEREFQKLIDEHLQLHQPA